LFFHLKPWQGSTTSIKGWFNLGRQRLTKDLATLGFGGAPMACSPALQTADEVIVKIAHMKISGHLSSVRPLRSNHLNEIDGKITEHFMLA
jgi:hypothetical protein